jgi:hypothetical protein
MEVLLDTTWRMAGFENERTSSLDRKAASLATFAAVVLTVIATLGRGFLEHFSEPWAVTLYLSALGLLVLAVGLSILVLLPEEQLVLGVEYLRRFPMWSESLKSPDEVRGETMQGLVTAIAREREVNGKKAAQVRLSFLSLGAGLMVVAAQAAMLARSQV